MSEYGVDCAALILTGPGFAWPCAIGRAGPVAADAKREGDCATPIGRWPIRGALLRPNRGMPGGLSIPWRWLRPNDGWCDAPLDPAYNRPVVLPYPASAEHLWKEHEAYDAILVLGHNDAPPAASMGSAIFWHVAQADATTANGLRATAGCVAIPRDAMIDMLPRLRPDTTLCISGQS